MTMSEDTSAEECTGMWYRVVFSLAVFLLLQPSGGAPLASGEEPVPASTFFSWSRAASVERCRLAPMTEKRVGFRLGVESRGCRVVLAVSAYLKAEKPSGYSTGSLAVDVNGELMGLKRGGRVRLLNRPLTFAFGPKGKRTQESAREGRPGLVENWGSAHWTLPWTPSFAAWLASPEYKPVNLSDPTWLILDITDLIYPASYNVLRLKNEGEKGVLVCEQAAVYVEPDRATAIEAVGRKMREKYFGRSAVRHEPLDGREWVYDMELVDVNHGAAGSMAEIQNLEDARKIVAPLKKEGYNTLMISGLHMRYTYTDYWESRIVPYMTHICHAAHEAGMKVVDHYDVPIFYSRGYPFLLADDHLDWTQRDIRFGTPTRMYCINNPDFRKHFFDFTRRVQREAGIDAYQIDEVYFFDQHFCGCEHCRRLFKEETGYELPREADSPVFFNNADPLWRLFMLWRGTCVQKFKRDFLASIHQVNPAAFLSTYTTTYLWANTRSNAWGNFLVSYTDGKEGVSRLPFHDYRYCLADFRTTWGVADALGHASWMLWYPLTGSAARFCWAMTQASGCAQWHSRQWSSSVRDLLVWPQKMKKLGAEPLADVALVFSDRSKTASYWTGCYHGMEGLGWGEAMVEHNIQYRVLHESALTPEALAPYKMVIVPQMTIVDDVARAAFEAYVRAGGTLVVTAETGLLDEEGRPRPDFLLGEMMNLRFVDMLDAPFELVEGKMTWTRDAMLYKYGARMLRVAIRDEKAAGTRILVHFRKDGRDYPGIVMARFGKGRVVSIATFLGVGNYQMGLLEGRRNIFKTHPRAAAFMAETLRSILGNNENLVGVKMPPNMIFCAWETGRKPGETAVHFLNVKDHKPLGPKEKARRRTIHFPVVDQPMSLLVRHGPVNKAVFLSPDSPNPVKCSLEKTATGVRVTIPPGSMAMYGLLKLE